MESIIDKKFKLDSLYTLASITIIALCGLLVNVVIQEFFDKEKLGQFSYIISIFLIINSIGTLGLNRAMVFYTSFYKDDIIMRNSLITTSLLMVFCWSILIYSAIYIVLNQSYINFFTIEQIIYFKIIFLSTPFYCINNVAISILNGVRKMKAYSLIRSFRWTALVLLIIVFSKYSLFKNVFFAFLFSEILIFIVISLIFTINKFLIFKVSKKNILDITSYIKYVYPSQILVSLNENIDIIIVEIFVTPGLLGVYSFSSKVAKSLNLVGVAIQTNFNPIISSCFKQNKLAELTSSCFKVREGSIKLFGVLVVFQIAAYYLLLKLYISDSSYIELFNYFILQSFAVGIFASFTWAGGMLVMTRKIKENIYRVISKLLINICIMYACLIFFSEPIGMFLGFSIVLISHLYIDKLFISRYLKIKIF